MIAEHIRVPKADSTKSLSDYMIMYQSVIVVRVPKAESAESSR
jgi:hypothetical protein